MKAEEIVQKKIEASRVKIAEMKSRAESLCSQAMNALNEVQRKVIDELDGKMNQVGTDAYMTCCENAAGLPVFWDHELWKDFEPVTTLTQETLPDRLQVGFWVPESPEVEEGGNDKEEDGDNFRVPAYVSWFGQQKTLIIKTNNRFYDEGLSLTKALIQRLHCSLPHYSQFTLLDPETNGAAFPMKRDITTRNSDADLYHILEEVIADMRRIIPIHALSEQAYFSTKVDSITMNEKYEFVIGANFPKGYEPRVIDKLLNIGNSGYIAGKYLILLYNEDEPLPRDYSIDMFKDAEVLDITKYIYYQAADEKFFMVSSPEADAEQWEFIVNRLKEFKPVERKITWKDYIEIPQEQMWQGDTREIIRTSIGDTGGQALDIWFGKHDGNNCAHGMLAATTGAGKSNFYHALILGLAVRYSPEELRMYLIDGKFGVEFEVYRNFPHAEVVSLKSSAELTGSILSELVKEVARRNEFFKTEGVNSYDEYRKKPQQPKKLPRILLLIDEYQVLFEGKEAMKASDDLRTLTAQARSAGIHLLLGSQRFNVPNMLNKDAIFGNIQLRIAMKMTQDDRVALTEFGREGKSYIATCDLPGKIVVNHNTGSDGSNQLGKVAFIGSEEKEAIIRRISERAQQDKLSAQVLNTIVFEGDSAPNMDENPVLMTLARNPEYLSAQEMQTLARRPENEGGFGMVEWNMSESPSIMWIGQEFNVYGQAAVVTKQRKMENILMVGDRNAARYGMLTGMLFSLALNKRPGQIAFYVYDRSVAGTDWNPFLGKMCNEVLTPAGYEVKFGTKVKEIGAGLMELNELLTSRLQLDQDERAELTPAYLFITEPEDVEMLNLEMDKNGFKVETETGKLLNNLYTQGPGVGIYVVLSCSGVISLQNVISKKQFMYFRHRIALQISEQESFDFLQNRQGALLQIHGDVPTVAFYADVNGNKSMKFKPYSIKDEGFECQFERIRDFILQKNG